MNSLRTLGVAIGLATLAACGGSEAQNDVNAADLNVALDSENVDAGLNVTDPALSNFGDQNVGADVNADADLANDSVALNATNTSE